MNGDIAILIAQFFFAAGALFLKKLAQATNPFLANAVVALLGTIAMIPLFLYFSKEIKISSHELLWAILVSVLSLVIGGALNTYGLSKIPLSHAALLVLAYPFFATLLAVLFLGEAITTKFAVGSFFIGVGYLVLTVL